MEIQESFSALPRKKTIQKWCDSAPDGFHFALRAWSFITHGAQATNPSASAVDVRQIGFFRSTEPVKQATKQIIESAQSLGAACIVFDTPASFTPTQENVERLRTYFGTMERPLGIRLVWEPRGVWQLEQSLKICDELQIGCAIDPISHASTCASFAGSSDWMYLKLAGADYNESQLYQLAEFIQNSSKETYCVFASGDGYKHALRLQTLIA